MDHRLRKTLSLTCTTGCLIFLISCTSGDQSNENTGNVIALDADDFGGTVTSANGKEAGVWVIAETTELPTRFIRIVVTDEEGRYVLPDLPQATYDIFVRGYGLVDSPRIKASPGEHLDLEGILAEDELSAAQIYPAAWWLSMMELPPGEHSQQRLSSSIGITS